MEKEVAQPDSLATVTIKPDYAPSEVYSSSEPPPAYQRPKSAAVQVAKIISLTVIAVSVLLGCFLLASAYVTANASCKQLEQELQFLSEAADRLQPLQPEALIQDEQHANRVRAETIQPEINSTPVKVQEITENVPQDSSDNSDDNVDNTSDDSYDDEEKTIHIKMPLELDFDDLAGALMEKNQRSKMNCIVEKKRAEQVVDHQPKTIQLPFGLNLTTDPRYEHVTGERMAIFCESGNEQRQQEPEEQEDTIMIQPVMIPIPPQNFHTHMPMQVESQQMPNRIPQSAMPVPPHPIETLRPPMPAPEQQTPPGFPPQQILQHIAQQIIAQKLQMEAESNQEETHTNEITEPEQQQINQQYNPHGFMMAHRIPIAEDLLTQINRLPNRDVFIALSEQDPMGHPREIQIPQRENTQSEEAQDYSRRLPVNLPIRVMQIQPEIQAPGALEMRPQPTSEQDSMDSDVHIMQQQQQRDSEDVTDRQIYSRDLPTNMPIRIMQLQQDTQAAASEEMRPHYLHPRSVRSVDSILPKSANSKRVKRCSCDCAC